MSECGLRSANVSLPAGVGGFNFEGIPEHILLWGCLMLISSFIYIFIQNIKTCKKFRFPSKKPSLYELLVGWGDEWLIKKRGIAGYQYIVFLRSLLEFATIFMLISVWSLAINYSQKSDISDPFESTTISSIPPKSSFQMLNLITSFLIPWLVVMMVARMTNKLGTMKPDASMYSRTLMIESNLGMLKGVNIKNYFKAKYPKLELIKISCSVDTRAVQKLFEELEFSKNVNDIFAAKYEEIESSSDGYTKHSNEYGRLVNKIEDEKDEASKQPPCIIFLTFLSQEQARKVFKEEKKKRKKIMFAPLPEEIIWSNVQSTSTRRKGWILSSICLFLLVLLCSTPAGFALQIQDLIGEIFGDTSNVRVVSTFLPPLLLLLFGVLVPMAVKINTVTYGSCSRPVTHASYMTSLFVWLTCSTIIFPILLAGAANMVEFSESLSSDGFEVILNKWECVFSAGTGSFYINLLLVVALFKCQLELHRVGDWTQLLITKIRFCKQPEKKQAARRKWDVDSSNRNGENLSLAVQYVWVIVFFTVWMFFCLTCPLITGAFFLLIFCKYVIVVHNFRHFYTAFHDQPELLITGAKLLIFASLFPQLNFALLMVVKQGHGEEDPIIMILAIFFLLVNMVIFIINEVNAWFVPIILMGPMTSPIKMFRRHEQSEYGKDSHEDYENPFMNWEVDYKDVSHAKTSPAWKQQIFVRNEEGTGDVNILDDSDINDEKEDRDHTTKE